MECAGPQLSRDDVSIPISSGEPKPQFKYLTRPLGEASACCERGLWRTLELILLCPMYDIGSCLCTADSKLSLCDPTLLTLLTRPGWLLSQIHSPE